MTGALIAGPRGRLLTAAGLGAWASAIALAPTPAFKAALAAPAVLIPLGLWTLATPGRWVACFFAAALLLPPLPVAWGDSGPHLCLLFAALGLFCGVLQLSRWQIPATRASVSLKNRDCQRADLPAKALTVLLVVLVASVAPALLYSGMAIAAGSLARVGLFAIGVYVFFYTAYGPGRDSGSDSSIRALYWIAVASALFACVDFYYQFPAPAGYGQQFVWLDSGVYRRAQGIFYDAGTLGNFCAFFLLMIAAELARRGGRPIVSRKGLAVGGAIFFAAAVLSYSRSSLVNVLIGLAVLAWVNRKRLRLARLAGGLLAGGTVVALVTWRVLPEFVNAYWSHLSDSTEFFFSATERVLSGRLASWYALWDWIVAHPWQALIGIGYKTLPYTDYLGGPVVGDNMYLSLLVEAGVLGLAALVWLHISVLRAGWRAAASPDSDKAFLGSWILCFWAGQVVQMLSVDLLTFWRVLPVYFWVLALAVRI